MKIALLAVSATLATLATISAAHAGVVAGTYTGASTDGNYVSFTIANDSNNVLAVTGISRSFSALCNDGSTLNTNWGYSVDQPIVNYKASITTSGNYFTIAFNLIFSADGLKVGGTTHAYAPTLSPVGPTPTKALLCKSLGQKLLANRQAAARVSPPARSAVYSGKLVTSGR